MILLKKIVGFIFILLGILISLVMFSKLVSFITKVAALLKAISEGDSYHISYYVTQLVFVVIGILLIYYLIRQGKEWMNAKEKNESPQNKIHTTELTKEQFKSTFTDSMHELPVSEGLILDIWPYAGKLTGDHLVHDHVLKRKLVEAIHRNSTNTFEHVLLPTDNKNIFIVVVIDLKSEQIHGHIKLDLEEEYGLKIYEERLN